MSCTVIYKHLAESSKAELQWLAEQSKNREVKELLKCIAQAASNEVLIIREAKDLTLNEAAKFLGVSLTYIKRLLNESVISFAMVGSHKRIPIDELLRFVHQRENARRRFAENVAYREKFHAQAVDELLELM
ncbi:MAG: excisionase family DNA-binding protein [Corynebacterium sp.]|uniref:excisionase family DNA-binding protein n=1 Tax=Corynebacterium sp. TaxID=1720 RepID=UPI0026DAFE3A|nr:excisionase family DNA-binding protein [Corynebacterium sp.]MDO4762100.1 excisionase family DNA-binding protein [Corynebacterium sp.]